MRVWNVGNELIDQLYNSNRYAINPGQVLDVPEDCGVFMLNKRVIRGMGLVQLKDGDDKEARYIEGRENIYAWSKEKWHDYETHCEERQAQSLQPLKAHKEILKYKVNMDEYEQWDTLGRIIPESIKPIAIEKERVYLCSVCSKEFPSKTAFIEHSKIHHKEEALVNSCIVDNTSSRKSR